MTRFNQMLTTHQNDIGADAGIFIKEGCCSGTNLENAPRMRQESNNTAGCSTQLSDERTLQQRFMYEMNCLSSSASREADDRQEDDIGQLLIGEAPEIQMARRRNLSSSNVHDSRLYNNQCNSNNHLQRARCISGDLSFTGETTKCEGNRTRTSFDL